MARVPRTGSSTNTGGSSTTTRVPRDWNVPVKYNTDQTGSGEGFRPPCQIETPNLANQPDYLIPGLAILVLALGAVYGLTRYYKWKVDALLVAGIAAPVLTIAIFWGGRKYQSKKWIVERKDYKDGTPEVAAWMLNKHYSQLDTFIRGKWAKCATLDYWNYLTNSQIQEAAQIVVVDYELDPKAAFEQIKAYCEIEDQQKNIDCIYDRIIENLA